MHSTVLIQACWVVPSEAMCQLPCTKCQVGLCAKCQVPCVKCQVGLCVKCRVGLCAKCRVWLCAKCRVWPCTLNITSRITRQHDSLIHWGPAGKRTPDRESNISCASDSMAASWHFFDLSHQLLGLLITWCHHSCKSSIRASILSSPDSLVTTRVLMRTRTV